MRSNDAGPCLCGDPACRRCFPSGGTYDPPKALIDTLNGLLDDAIRRHTERSTEETFEECILCGEWEGHTDQCPIPAIDRFLRA